MNSTDIESLDPMIVVTRGIKALMDTDQLFALFVDRSLEQFLDGEWGNIPTDEKEANDKAMIDLDKGEPDMAQGVYMYPGGVQVWIIRDINATTVLFPSEY